MLHRLIILLATTVFISCTGMTFGENTPDQDTFVDTPELPPGETATGSIAVDGDTESIYVQQSRGSSKHLWRANPDTGAVREVANLTGYRDTRVLFPQDHVLVMAEKNGTDSLFVYDSKTLELENSWVSGARYHGTRTSPSGRHIAVADNAVTDTAPIHVIPVDSLQAQVIPHNGFWLEAMWLNQTDELFAIVFYDDDDSPHARILSWAIDDLTEHGFSKGPEGLWLNPVRDILLPGARPDFAFSFTWVGVAPDDSKVVFPLRRTVEGGTVEHYLSVLDTQTGDVTDVADARGPVGFTPDSSTIVSYRYGQDDPDAGSDSKLVLIDTNNLEQTVLDIPTSVAPQYFVTREGNFVVVASNLGSTELVLFDLDNLREARLEGPSLDLHEFISRLGHHELWLVDDGLFRLDMMAASVREIPLGWTPSHINILPGRDRLVLDDSSGDRLFLYNPETTEVTRTIELDGTGPRTEHELITSQPRPEAVPRMARASL